MSLINCPDCQKSISENAASCPGCGFVLTPDVIIMQKAKQQQKEDLYYDKILKKQEADGIFFAAMIPIGFVILGILCFTMNILPPISSSKSTSNSSSPSQYFSSDKERLEWRSQHDLPMTDEDVRYEQGKVLEGYGKLKASERSIGR